MRQTVYAGNIKSKFKVESSKCAVKSKIQHSNFKIRNYIILFSLLVALPLVVSCSTTYLLYSTNIFHGKSALKLGRYEDAKQYFNEATRAIRDAKSLSYLAIIEYKMNNLDNAEKLTREAEKADGKYYGFDRLRILGYKSLILLKKNNGEGFDALKDYIDAYACVYPMPTLYDVEQMWIKKDIRFDLLEKLIEEQVLTYDNDMEQYLTTRTGFYQRGQGGGWDF